MLSAETITRLYELIFQLAVALSCGIATIIVLLVVLAFLSNAAEAIAEAANEQVPHE